MQQLKICSAARRSLGRSIARWARPGTAAVLAVAAVAALGTTSAKADLIVSVDDPGEPLWLIDVDTNTYTPILSGYGAQAIANDANTSTLYFMTNTVTLYRWEYGMGNAPELIGNTTNPNGTSPNTSITGLGFDNAGDTLYGTRTLGATNVPEGLYTINTDTAVTSLVGAFPSEFDIGAFDIDPVTGTAYGFSDGNTSGAGIGLYQIDLTDGSSTLVAPAPPGSIPSGEARPDIDGLAVGDGKIYLVEDDAVQAGGTIYVYDIATGMYETPLQTPWFFNETFSGATWVADGAFVPEPASLGLLGLAGLALVRRR